LDLNRINTRLVPLAFEYHAPERLEEALRILKERGKDAVVFAGGTDLLVKMKQRSAEPKAIVNIKRIPSLSYIRDGPTSIKMGPAARVADIERSPAVARRFPMLVEAVSFIGSVQIRNMATIGGNLCNASPAADGSVALLALDSTLSLKSLDSTREVPLGEFFRGPGKTVMKPQELLTEITVPNAPARTGMAFARIARTDMDLAKVNVAVVLHLEAGRVSAASIALGAVAPTPMRATKAEETLTGRRLSNSLVSEAATVASEATKPITDVRSTAEYRKEVTAVLVRRSLGLAWRRAGER